MENYKKSQVADILGMEPKDINSQIRAIKSILTKNGLGPKNT